MFYSSHFILANIFDAVIDNGRCNKPNHQELDFRSIDLNYLIGFE